GLAGGLEQLGQLLRRMNETLGHGQRFLRDVDFVDIGNISTSPIIDKYRRCRYRGSTMRLTESQAAPPQPQHRQRAARALARSGHNGPDDR
ncbi:MAG: hypothetical protein V3T11_06150, partial [Roseateles sp.]